MGTRGAFGFRSNKQDRVQYNHFDSYPTGLGQEVLEFIKSSNLEELTEIASRIQMVDESSKPTKKQIKECEPWTNLSVSESSTDDWYCLLRESQGNLQAYRKGLSYMLDAKSFLLDSLFCEYAYIINTDENVLEFYSGFNEKVRTRMGRYAGMQVDKGRPYNYYGIALVAKFSLKEIVGASNDTISNIVKQMDKKVNSFRNRQEREKKKQKATV